MFELIISFALLSFIGGMLLARDKSLRSACNWAALGLIACLIAFHLAGVTAVIVGGCGGLVFAGAILVIWILLYPEQRKHHTH